MNQRPQESEPQQPSVIFHEKNGFCIANFRWAGGQPGEMHFPIGGFPVGDPAKGTPTHYSKDHAKQVLEENAGQMTREEFAWEKFPPKKKSN